MGKARAGIHPSWLSILTSLVAGGSWLVVLCFGTVDTAAAWCWECSNGIDDDGDGLIDQADPGCWNTLNDPASYNQFWDNEGRATSQCQDSVDNDLDGSTDGSDPECLDPLDNDESIIEPRIFISLECVSDIGEQGFAAYFTYFNPSAQEIHVSSDVTTGAFNGFSPPQGDVVPPEVFAPGRFPGAFHVRFDGTPLTWILQGATWPTVSAEASAASPQCSPIEPIAQCTRDDRSVVFGYDNPNPFPISIPHGTRNILVGETARETPLTTFPPGRVDAAFEAPFEPGLVWKLNGRETRVTQELRTCSDSCVNVVIMKTKGDLDETAVMLAALAGKAAILLKDKRRVLGGSKTINRVRLKRDALDASRASRKAIRLAKHAKTLVLQLPDVSKTCPHAPPECRSIDRSRMIEELRSLYRRILNQVRRSMARRNFKETGSTSRFDKLVQDAKTIKANGESALERVPRVAIDCR